MKKNKKKGAASRRGLTVRLICIVAVLALLSGAAVLGFLRRSTPAANIKTQEYLISDVTRADVEITRLNIYGNHLLIDGKLSLAAHPGFRRVGLVLRSSSGKETEIVLRCDSDGDTASFRSADSINSGICLDELEAGDYCVLFKIVTDKGKSYVSVSNTEKKTLPDYYTVTVNGANRRVKIGFESYRNGSRTLPCLAIKITKARLPGDVYDIVIDPGHGGADPGASGFGHNEAELTLEISKELADNLKRRGLKVLLTRDGSEKPDEMTAAAAYSKNGRVNTACDSGAKYNFSIHLNSVDSPKPDDRGGVEVYCPNGCDTAFAESIAAHLVSTAGTNFSTHEFSKVGKGVYIRTFSASDVAESAANAKKNGFKPYENLSTDTTYYYMIRELGGLCTGAYIDGRNPDGGRNEHFDSPVGIESYLLELGYICIKSDLDRILASPDSYAAAVADAIAEEIGIE